MSKIDELIKKLCPNGVEYKTIGEIATYRRGSFPQPYTNSSFYGGEGAMPFVQVADIEDEGFVLKEKTKQTISKIAQPKSIFVPKGNVICSIQGTIGRVAITQYDAYVDRTIAIFEGFKIAINKRFFAYCIQVKFGIEKQFARGSTLKTITKEEFTKFCIPVPPLEVQDEIVHILDDFTLLSAELSAELKDRRKQFEYYRDKLINENFEKMVSLKDLCEIKGRIGFRGYTRNDLVNKGEGAISFSPGNISNETINYDKCTYVSWEKYNESPEIMINNGDILLCKTGSTLGKVAMIKDLPEKATINPQLVVLKNLKCDPKYLKYVIGGYYFQNEMQSKKGLGSVPNISQKDIGNIVIKLHDTESQIRIGTILSNLDSMCNDILEGLPAEIEARQKQYEYYRDKLLTFKELKVNEG